MKQTAPRVKEQRKGEKMKNDKEFVDAVYEKYNRAKTEEKKRAARRKRTWGYVGAAAACLILFVGIIGVKELKPDKGMDAQRAQDISVYEVEQADGKAAENVTDNPAQTADDQSPDKTPGDVEMNEPYMTDQGLVNEVLSRQGSIRGIELSESKGSSIESLFLTDQADISAVVDWLMSHQDAAMSEATFYSNFSTGNMPDTYFVMSAQFSQDPADSIDVYIVTDTAPGFN